MGFDQLPLKMGTESVHVIAMVRHPLRAAWSAYRQLIAKENMGTAGEWVTFAEKYFIMYHEYLLVAKNSTFLISYESFSDAPVRVADAMLNKFRSAWGDPFPSRTTTLRCSEDVFYRNPPIHYASPIYTDGELDQPHLQRMCSILSDVWLESEWGPC